MSRRKMQPLAEGYGYEIDTRDKQSWDQLMLEFEDGNVFQTWAYAEAEAGPRSLSPLILTRNNEAVAAALVRFKRLPVFGAGLAYVYKGPMWRRRGAEVSVEDFRQALRALRSEFVCKRGLTLRMNPAVFDNDRLNLGAIIGEEGFLPISGEERTRTILMDLTRSLADLQEGMDSRWRRGLKTAEKNNLELIEGTSEELIDQFNGIYSEMVSRKKFVSAANPQRFRQIQAQLPEALKVKVLLCKSEQKLCAGLIYSGVGTNAIFLLGATSNDSMKSRASYLLHWQAIKSLKQQGTVIYDLNGIDPVQNPGTYVFKKGLAGSQGCEVCHIGRFDASAGYLSRVLLRFRDAFKTRNERVQQ